MSLDASKEKVQELSINDLLDLQVFIDEVIQVKKDEAINEALQPLQELANKLGVPLSSILDKNKTKRSSSGSRTPKAELPVAYRSKSNPELVWSGRGNRPKWVKEELANGAKLEDFKV